MIINEVELNFDIFDAETAKRYEEGLERVQLVGKNQKHTKLSETIEAQCNAVFDFFDDLFGDGTSDDIFEGKMNLMICLKAFEEVINAANEQQKEAEQFTSKYNQNRAQRRANR